jgi:hypothetical protein
VSVYEAADILGVTVDALRKRISRGSIPHERDDDGRVWVLMDAASKVHDIDQEPYRTVSALEFIEEMRGRIDDLREQLAAERRANEENRRIIAALTQRIPEIEAPRGERESPTEPAGGADQVEARPAGGDAQEGTEQTRPQERSWWRKMFGG